jgi:hypothetical protein
MPMIIRNRSGFHEINVLPNGCKFNASHYITNIFGPLADWRTLQVQESNWKLIIHADNGYPRVATMTQQFLDQNAMNRAPHPAYLPNFAPSNF